MSRPRLIVIVVARFKDANSVVFGVHVPLFHLSLDLFDGDTIFRPSFPAYFAAS